MRKTYSKRRSLAEVLKLGRDLAAMREFAGGHFVRLCKELEITAGTAYRAMEATQYVDAKLSRSHAYLLEHLSPKLLYELARANVPAELLEKLLKKHGKLTAMHLHALKRNTNRHTAERSAIDKIWRTFGRR